MKNLIMFLVLAGSVNSLAGETAKVTCTLKQGWLSGEEVYSITVDAEPKVPFFINPTEFFIDGAKFSGMALNGAVQAEVVVDDNKITGSSGLESYLSLLRINHEPLALTCRFNK